jgi:uncharacterized protein DUF4265
MVEKKRKYPERLLKVKFELPSDAWHGHSSESLWVEELTSCKYRIENSPFFAIGVSFEDIVTASNRGGDLCFDGVVIFGGHSTYRIILEHRLGEEAFFRHWKPIEELGCSYERANFGYEIFAVDVPPKADIHEVYKLLSKGEDDRVWGFEEGHCGHNV